MSFLGDALKEMLNDVGVVSGNSAVRGTPFKRADRKFFDFYELVQFEFGLTPAYRVQENAVVPVKLSVGFDGKPYAFAVQGSVHRTRLFASRGGLFDTLSREVPTPRGYEWAFDLTRIGEGILTGKAVLPNDEAYFRSEETLKILRCIDGAILKQFSTVPVVFLDLSATWHQFGIPDRIHFTVQSMHPFSEDDMLNAVRLITHSYSQLNAPVKFTYSGNHATGTMEISARMVPQAPAHPPQTPSAPAEAPTAAPKSFDEHLPVPPTVKPAEGDEFPYDFYKGLGLIDNENMVAVPSILGPVRIPMTSEQAKEFLLAYKPENQ